ncbi:MAG: aminoglycoside phosphotransferase family protein [Clostridia bacterium]|nr:aminoglycoside phosphotransferase family protein [Clostridia bacterium]
MERFETNEETEIKSVCEVFGLKGEYRSYEIINSGHINTTYRVFFFRNGEMKDYILQKVNTYVFKNPVQVMENISTVTEFIRAKIKQKQATAKRNVLHYSTTGEGEYYTYTPDNSFWRCCRYIDDSVSFLKTDNLKVIEESGKAFGQFQEYLSDFPVEKLHIVIPHFHNTVKRYETFRAAIANNAANRVSETQEEIKGYLDVEDIATKMYRLQREGVLPLRVTHNDTKISNVLFDAKTLQHLSVIDLDTVMPGLVAFDFGDAIRISASTGEEDEQDLESVALDMEKYEAFTRGFVSTLGKTMTQAEKDTLALGAVAMTVECGMRFLTDYLDGDKYFKIHYPDQNLVRARCHLVLAHDMIKRLDEMQAIVYKYCNE